MNTIPWKREAGKKPDKEQMQKASTLVTLGTKTHMVIAMALRPNGLTQNEVVTLLGHPYRNSIKKLLKEDKVKQYELPEGTRSRRIRLVLKQG